MVSADGLHDVFAHSADLYALVHDERGCVASIDAGHERRVMALGSLLRQRGLD